MLEGIQGDFLVPGFIPVHCHSFSNVQHDKFSAKKPITATTKGHAPDPNGINTPTCDVKVR
jgi:hypothetical protein